jgi:hypothetical protein
LTDKRKGKPKNGVQNNAMTGGFAGEAEELKGEAAERQRKEDEYKARDEGYKSRQIAISERQLNTSTSAFRLSLCLFGISFITGAVSIWQGFTASRNADTAREALENSKTSTRSTTRAYIGVEPTSVSDFKVGSVIAVSFNVKNFGQTPAYGMQIYTDVKVLPHPYTGPFPFYKPNGFRIDSEGALYPKSEPLTTGKHMESQMTKEDMDKIKSGDSYRLYAGGTVQYFDIFEQRHCARFFASLGGPPLVAAINAAASGQKPIVPWIMARAYNDEKCEYK